MGRNPHYRPSWCELAAAAGGHGRTDVKPQFNYYLIKR